MRPAGTMPPSWSALVPGLRQAHSGGANLEVVAVHYVPCPLCSLRYSSRPELELHVREDHCPAPPPEGRASVVVPKPASYERPRHLTRR